MADVYGAIGDQPVELNNAATEATLKALLATMTAMMNSQSKNTKKDKKKQMQLEAIPKNRQKIPLLKRKHRLHRKNILKN